ncbi:MAG TPA: DUF4915 domain-containing protein [Candidatus Micrarchaeia archaeon]|nr:DUF4915 domain-containing protein [Candidatus Micrarchaeia archaeon]
MASWGAAASVDRDLLQFRSVGRWWEFLDRSGLTLLVGREYEHLVVALSIWQGRPHVSYLPLPHPSGIAYDSPRGLLHVASTRNPNQVFTLAPITQVLPLRPPAPSADLSTFRPLAPRSTTIYPGSLYLHDLAMIGGRLHGAAAGRNTIVALDRLSRFHDVWWPRSIAPAGRPLTDRNYIQLNSIAAGTTLDASCFTASSVAPSTRRPGHRNYPVNRRGIVLAGRSGEPIAFGLTRPHSARFWADSLLVANSGYGELVATRAGHAGFDVVARLPGWTRGLAVVEDAAVVGTSRILPGFEQYAPGLDPARAVCGLHAVRLTTAEVIGSLLWPAGDQIFAIEVVPRAWSHGFLHAARQSAPHLDPPRILFAYSP